MNVIHGSLLIYDNLMSTNKAINRMPVNMTNQSLLIVSIYSFMMCYRSAVDIKLLKQMESCGFE